MMGGRTLLVGGLSSIHDPIAAAALRGVGIPSTRLHPPTDAGLRRARAFGNHGQCNPAHYAVGAVLEHARTSGQTPPEFVARHAWLTVGSCGPCRLAAFGLEYARVLGGAGLAGLPVAMIEQLCFADAELPGRLARLDPTPADALLLAVVAADVIASVGHRLRPHALDPTAVDALLGRAVDDVAASFERRASILPALGRLRGGAQELACDPGRVLPRVLLVGEPWTTVADGDPSYDLVRRLEVFGAEVETPTASHWLLHRLWEARRDARRGDARRLTALRRADRRIRAAFRLFARAAGLTPARLDDGDALAAIAAPHYDPDVRGGSVYLEVARALTAARDRTAHLVLSLKPFGCLPSSSLSDGVLGVLIRAFPHVRFLAVETTGDADAAAESRVEMAIHAATLAAYDEFEAACASRGIAPSRARSELAAHGRAAATGPRVYACTAAEIVRRGPVTSPSGAPSLRASGARG